MRSVSSASSVGLRGAAAAATANGSSLSAAATAP